MQYYFCNYYNSKGCMFIFKTHAELIVKELHVIICHDVNIIDKNCIIIASSNPNRIGTPDSALTSSR